MASLANPSMRRFDRDNRPRPLVLAFVVASHLLFVLMFPNLFADEYDTFRPSSDALVIAPVSLPEPLPEQVEPVDVVFEETDSPGLSGGNSQAGTPRPSRRNLPERERPPIPQSDIRLSVLQMESADGVADMDAGRLGTLAGPLGRLGEGAGRGDGTGNGNGRGDAGEGSGGVDTTRNVDWSPRFNRRVVQQFMPRAARRQRIYGLVVLECTALQEDRVSDCTIIEEHPQGHGFGEAALATEPHLLLQVTDGQGNRIYGERIRPYLEFRVR